MSYSITINDTTIKNCPDDSNVFNDMYAGDKNPWGQKSDNVDSEVKFISKNKFDYICDIGCGLGHSLNDFSKAMNINNCMGLDVSENCVNRATEIYPEYNFLKYDITNIQDYIFTNYGEGTALYLLRGVLWYVGKGIHQAAKNISSLMIAGDILYISQPFSNHHVEWDGEPNCNIIKTLFKDFDIVREKFVKYDEKDHHYVGVLRKHE